MLKEVIIVDVANVIIVVAGIPGVVPIEADKDVFNCVVKAVAGIEASSVVSLVLEKIEFLLEVEASVRISFDNVVFNWVSSAVDIKLSSLICSLGFK